MSGEPFIHPLIQIRPAPSRRIAIEASFFRNLLYFRLTGEKQLGSYLWIWIYCNPLKSHKTAKTFFGKAWHWNRISLEKLGIGTAFLWKSLEKSLEAASPGRAEPSAPRHDAADRFDYFAASP
jgi:hypothetical protein